MRNLIIATALLMPITLGVLAYFMWWPLIWLLIILLPLSILALYDAFQKKSSILRNFPILGRTRYIAEWLRPKLYQYFIESDIDGKPFSRINRSIIYQRAKHELSTNPFGTQLDVYEEGYEWVNHSIAAKDHHDLNSDPRVLIGGKDCKKPYSASIFNISAMSYGSLSKNAVMAMNGGAKIGGFAHNTGEGGVSPYHNKFGGDLIYQIGTGYFGSRSEDGGFSNKNYQKLVAQDNIKMIEIKLSQGAKPGHGGILPAKKVTEEISKIRNVPLGKDVLSPPYHKEFNTPIGLLQFVKKCRDLSGGKPVGFKLCIGHKSEFIAICKAMLKTGIKPDFISIDGGEGGTGAAPLEFTNSVGMPMLEGLVFAYNTLIGFSLKKEIKLIAAGKVATGFDIFRNVALGADLCYSARAMMMAVGCIQALECNQNSCPVGVATQDEELVKGLVVSDKKQRLANYHESTVESFVELMAASGLMDIDQINRRHINKRVLMNKTSRYDELYPYTVEGILLDPNTIPMEYQADMAAANANSFLPKFEEVYIEED